MRPLRRLAVIGALVGAVVAYRNKTLARNERRYADVLVADADADAVSDNGQRPAD